jgi:hypothetical protein
MTKDLLKSLTKTTPRPKGERIEAMVSTTTRREMAAIGLFKLSKPMDPATAQHLTQQRARHQKWAGCL